eukprot:TRINITY_DN5554_c0_g1_i2.p1 TRINITY_DN5554_c0_g1~~TRINITY_DN5554_c0_g1_i2.p1  ORF type:complete len:318 (+),score=38.90 TRINITY_DN5554_c0_g1_i2:78-1031(+)
MVSERRERSLAVHFSSDMVDVIEIADEQRNESHEMECKKKNGYIMGEPCPDLSGGDMTGEEEWKHYYSALKIRMRCAKHQSHQVNQREARRRAFSLRKRLDNVNDEAHLGLVSRKCNKKPSRNILSDAFHGDGHDHQNVLPRQTSASSYTSSSSQLTSASSYTTSFSEEANETCSFPRQASASSDATWFPRQTSARSVTSSFPRQTSASSASGLFSKASLASSRWLSSWRAARNATPMTKCCPQCPADEIQFQGNALNASECMYREERDEEPRTTSECSDSSTRSPTSARLHRMVQWSKAMKGKRSRVHMSFDSLVP